ncbi:hypothetical protein [Sphingomonas melonis]|uniref:hypothetical protein n=1 Tax=Sphingomonas melonis TaxID=152682 RepID=UPI0035C86732
MPEPTNADRADWAESALDTFGQDTYCGRLFTDEVAGKAGNTDSDAYTMVQDLMTNLMHVARRYGWDAAEMTRKAAAMFEDELAEEGDVP